MFSETLKIIPKVESRDLTTMENNMNGRFSKIAKKFSGGLLNAIKGGGVFGIAVGLVDKFLNPLKEVQEALDKTLSKGDDLSTFAKQFNTTAGNLARLQAFGRSAGLDPEGVRLLLGKFQGSVSQAALDPSKPTSVSSFVGRKDTAEAFFEFVQSMQHLNATQQSLVQQEVFGEKQILKASEFLHADFKFLSKALGGPSAEELTQAAERIGALSDTRDLLAARRDNVDLVTKSKLLGPRTIGEISRGEDVDLARENKRLANFDDLKKISMATDKMVKLFEDAYLKLAPVLGTVLPYLMNDLVVQASKAAASRTIRGMVPGAGKDK